MASKLGWGEESSYSSKSSYTNSYKKPQPDSVMGHSTHYGGGSSSNTTSKNKGAADYGIANNQTTSSSSNKKRQSKKGGARVHGDS